MKIFRYAGVGATAATVDFLIFAVFAKLLNFNYLAVGAVGFRKVISLVFLISFIGLAVNQAVLYFGIGILGWEMLFIKLCATGSVFF